MPTTLDPPTLVPASLDPRIPDLDSFEVYFGIRVADIGEDGDLIALGHHDPKAALAAFNAHAKKFWGLVDLLDGAQHDQGRWLWALENVKQKWAVSLTDRCRECAKDGLREECTSCSDVRATIKEGSWWIAYDAAEDEPGAFPVTVWRC
ncbi:hypothetical protein K1W54_04770 [Micromonospora sp. CPCC 205371]|nr:hypothetical protein [Micromonospora sp. CPCC 205371]